MLENLNQFANRTSYPNGCKLGALRKSLDESDQKILDDALANVDGFSTNSLYQGLRNLGFDVGYQTVYRHRRGLCACGRVDA